MSFDFFVADCLSLRLVVCVSRQVVREGGLGFVWVLVFRGLRAAVFGWNGLVVW